MKNYDYDIDKLGRKIYNCQSIKNDFKDFYSDFIGNLETGELLSRNIEIKCSSIKDMIRNQRLIDISLCNHLKTMEEHAKKDDFIYKDSFSISYKFPNFISNIEIITLNTSTSGKPYRMSEIKTLGAYSNMEYNCWDVLDNNKIQTIFKGKKEVISYKEKYALSQVISLFACESSRNPTTYITAPMVLELAENEIGKIQNIKNHYKIEEITTEEINNHIVDLYKIKDRMLYLQNYKCKYKTTNEIDNEIEHFKYLYVTDKSTIIKDCFFRLFPMAIDKAVSGSRTISDKLNLEQNDQYLHQYDYGRANINKEQELKEKNNNLKKLWGDAFPNRKVTDLVQDWYDIELIGSE
jgi:hypothetical protein